MSMWCLHFLSTWWFLSLMFDAFHSVGLLLPWLNLFLSIWILGTTVNGIFLFSFLWVHRYYTRQLLYLCVYFVTWNFTELVFFRLFFVKCLGFSDTTLYVVKLCLYVIQSITVSFIESLQNANNISCSLLIQRV